MLLGLPFVAFCHQVVRLGRLGVLIDDPLGPSVLVALVRINEVGVGQVPFYLGQVSCSNFS